jgi:hypothetical protein
MRFATSVTCDRGREGAANLVGKEPENGRRVRSSHYKSPILNENRVKGDKNAGLSARL